MLLRYIYAVFCILTVTLNYAHAKPPQNNPLPDKVRLIEIEQRSIQIRELGTQHKNKDGIPTIILLSGPNENWHSDSAWFALLQPLLAKQYHVISIDRAGNGWSSSVPQPSYRQFADDLPKIINKLSLSKILVVNYASSNITSLLIKEKIPQLNIQGMLWIDPDIILPHSIGLYSAYPANWYKSNIAKLLPHLAKSNWTRKTYTKNTNEVILIDSLLTTENIEIMDWTYFSAMQQQRTTINNQQNRALEISNYGADLNAVANILPISSVPISVIDSDFELKGLQGDEDNYLSLKQWQKEGSLWSKKITDNSGGKYWPTHSSEHLVVFQKPQLIIQAIEDLIIRSAINKQKNE